MNRDPSVKTKKKLPFKFIILYNLLPSVYYKIIIKLNKFIVTNHLGFIFVLKIK